MQKHLALLLIVAAGLSGCGGGGGNSQRSATPPTLITNIAVPNATTPAFSFDISYAEDGQYYLADRNNKAVDVVDTASNTLAAQIAGPFAGAGPTTNESGPDGLVGIPGAHTIYVGDVDSVKVVDTNARQITNTIPISTSGQRVDEGCYDPDDNLVMIASPGDTPPFVSFISVASQTVTQKLVFNGSTGLEACAYDPKSKNFFINNDGTAANPNGELDVIPAASVTAGSPTVTSRFPLGNCAPAGIVLGPGNDVLIGCDPPAGDPLITLILDRTSGAVLSTVPFGGVDQVAYDSQSDRYFLPARHWVSSGTAAASGYTPVMGVIDGKSRQLLFKVPVGTGAHSVAIDSARQEVYVPYQVGQPGFPNGGISVFTTQ